MQTESRAQRLEALKRDLIPAAKRGDVPAMLTRLGEYADDLEAENAKLRDLERAEVELVLSLRDENARLQGLLKLTLDVYEKGYLESNHAAEVFADISAALATPPTGSDDKPLHIEGPVEGLDGSDPGAGSINRRPK